jgi:hypothetical protein
VQLPKEQVKQSPIKIDNSIPTKTETEQEKTNI